MRKLSNVKLNSITGFISQILAISIQFFTRFFFVKYLGLEILGVSSTFSSILSTLSLAELGFQTAIVHSLYKPLVNKEEKRINDIINIFKTVYNIIGFMFLIAGFAGLPAVKYMLSDINITYEIYMIFLLLALNSTISYMLAYKRILLYADQKDYICKIVDLGCNILLSICKIIILVITGSYLLYLSITIFHTFISNLIINILCKKKYPYLHKGKLNRELLKVLFMDVKNVFLGKICNYVYASTDNIIISRLISTITVGFFANYMLITKNLASLVSSILNPVAPYIGNKIAIENDKEEIENSFLMYSYIRVFCSLIIVVPLVVLISDFIAYFFGRDSVLDNWVMYLISADLYISIAYASCYDFINGAGLFQYDKYIQLISSSVNIIVSIVLTKRIGLYGVVIGTVISQSFMWIGRSYLVFQYCFRADLRCYLLYWVKNLYYIVCTVMIIKVCKMIYLNLHFSNYLLMFILMGIICEIIVVILFNLLTCRHIENKRIILRLRIIKLSHNKEVFGEQG